MIISRHVKSQASLTSNFIKLLFSLGPVSTENVKKKQRQYIKKNTCKTISARNLTGFIFVIWFPSRPIPLNEVLGGSQHMLETGNTFHSSTYDISPRKLHVLKSIRLKVMKSIELLKLQYIIYIWYNMAICRYKTFYCNTKYLKQLCIYMYIWNNLRNIRM